MGHQPLRVLVGSLAPGVLPSTQPAKMPTGTILLDLGPEHPSQAGLIELRLWTENDVHVDWKATRARHAAESAPPLPQAALCC